MSQSKDFGQIDLISNALAGRILQPLCNQQFDQGIAAF
jgi:hypothetical protein